MSRYWIDMYLKSGIGIAVFGETFTCTHHAYCAKHRNVSELPEILYLQLFIFQKRFPLNLFNIQDKWGITQLPVLICPFFPCIRTTIKAYPRCHDFHIYICFFGKCKAWKEGFESKLFRSNISQNFLDQTLNFDCAKLLTQSKLNVNLCIKCIWNHKRQKVCNVRK